MTTITKIRKTAARMTLFSIAGLAAIVTMGNMRNFHSRPMLEASLVIFLTLSGISFVIAFVCYLIDDSVNQPKTVTQETAQRGDDCVCEKCGTRGNGLSCSQCGQPDYWAILEVMYDIGSRCKIARFINRSKSQWRDKFDSCNDEEEVWSFVRDQRNYLVTVIGQMFNPPITSGDVSNLNQITKVLEAAPQNRARSQTEPADGKTPKAPPSPC